MVGADVVLVVSGAGIEGEGLFDEVASGLGKFGVGGGDFRGGSDGELRGWPGGEAGAGFGEGFVVGQVGSDVEDGGAVDEVDSADPEGGAVFNGGDFQEADEGEAEAVGTEGGAGGEDAEFLVSTEAGGADDFAGVFFVDEVELEGEPEVGESFEAAEGVRTEGWFEDDGAGGGGGEAGLAWDAEFIRVAALEKSDGNGRGHVSGGWGCELPGAVTQITSAFVLRKTKS